MSNMNATTTSKVGDDPPRRPYEPPAIEETSDFETLALSCGLANPDACEDGPQLNS
jgi:hypothetical protein